jgi:hypothetical protein
MDNKGSQACELIKLPAHAGFFFLVSRIVQHSNSIDLVTKSIMIENESVFRLVREEILADSTNFILYQAPSNAILLEIQPNITKVSLKQSIEKCLEVQSNVDTQLFLVILCTGKISLSVKSIVVFAI